MLDLEDYYSDPQDVPYVQYRVFLSIRGYNFGLEHGRQAFRLRRLCRSNGIELHEITQEHLDSLF